jgi:hypothetical protein
MTMLIRIMAAALAAIVVSLGGPAVAQALPRGDTITGPCDRECLRKTLDDYLAAMVDKDPSRLLWATRAKYTENGQVLRVGEALWATATALSDYRMDFIDETGGQAGFLGVVYENGNPVILGMRLKVVNHRILEVEHIVSRNAEGAQALLDGAGPDPLFSQDLADEERAPREQLIAAANSYFDGIEQSSGSIVPFADDCTRVENGMRTAPSATGGTCAQQFDTGAFSYITECRDRRFEVVDEITGNVLAFVIFAHPGNVTHVQIPGQERRDMHPAALRPFDTQIAEVFNVRAGKIRRIEASINTAAFGISSGWEE